MSYGLKSKNDNGYIQIDGVYRNLSLEESQSSKSVVNGATYTDYFTSFNITNSTLVPLILFQPNTDYFSCVDSYTKSGSNWVSFKMVTERRRTTSINYKVYRQNPAKSGDAYGMRVYDGSANLVFDNGLSYFKIASVHSVNISGAPNSNPPTNYVDITHDAVNPYYILSPQGFWVLTSGGGSQKGILWWKIGLKKLSSTSVRISWFLFASGVTNTPLNQGLNPSMKLIVCSI
jgi:hypothetical protein